MGSEVIRLAFTCAPGYNFASGTAERGVGGRLLPDAELSSAEALGDDKSGGGATSGYN